jgi:hypothetical protein
VKILNEVRWGEVSPEAQAALLQCTGAEHAAASDGVEPTKLYPHKVHKGARGGWQAGTGITFHKYFRWDEKSGQAQCIELS